MRYLLIVTVLSTCACVTGRRIPVDVVELHRLSELPARDVRVAIHTADGEFVDLAYWSLEARVGRTDGGVSRWFPVRHAVVEDQAIAWAENRKSVRVIPLDDVAWIQVRGSRRTERQKGGASLLRIFF